METGFEEQLRELLARDADAVRPAPAPYPAIRRRGLAERRRRAAVTGTTLMALAAVPAGAYVMGGPGTGSVVPGGAVRAVPTATALDPEVARPASEGQLLDGVTFQRASAGLAKCLADAGASELGRPDSYRILLGMKAAGDSNSPGNGIHVVAVRKKSPGFRVICTVKNGRATGINSGSVEAGPVVPDINAGKLYQQSVIDKGHWTLPSRWGTIGRVDSSVAKVTVSYGDSVADPAVLDHGWFVAAGILGEQVTEAPHIRGYDAEGDLVYDSDSDPGYERGLP